MVGHCWVAERRPGQVKAEAMAADGKALARRAGSMGLTGVGGGALTPIDSVKCIMQAGHACVRAGVPVRTIQRMIIRHDQVWHCLRVRLGEGGAHLGVDGRAHAVVNLSAVKHMQGLRQGRVIHGCLEGKVVTKLSTSPQPGTGGIPGKGFYTRREACPEGSAPMQAGTGRVWDKGAGGPGVTQKRGTDRVKQSPAVRHRQGKGGGSWAA